MDGTGGPEIILHRTPAAGASWEGGWRTGTSRYAPAMWWCGAQKVLWLSRAQATKRETQPRTPGIGPGNSGRPWLRRHVICLSGTPRGGEDDIGLPESEDGQPHLQSSTQIESIAGFPQVEYAHEEDIAGESSGVVNPCSTRPILTSPKKTCTARKSLKSRLSNAVPQILRLGFLLPLPTGPRWRPVALQMLFASPDRCYFSGWSGKYRASAKISVGIASREEDLYNSELSWGKGI